MSAFLAQVAIPRDDLLDQIDWFALSPEITLLIVGVILTVLDIVLLEKGRAITPAVAGLGLLAPLVPIIMLANAGITDAPRMALGPAYIVDGYSLALKALFLLIGYLVVLMSTNYIAEGDYWESEYYGMLVSSILGMVIMTSARDLITVFVALELLSIPAYLMATWRKRDLKSNEAGVKYYLNGVFATALMLYGMSLLFGISGSTILADINTAITNEGPASQAMIGLGIVLVIVGFGFKVSAVPFHLWAPDTYEGAPTPVAAFLAVGAKTAGFVALMNLVFVGFFDRSDFYAPALWVLAALTMTVGNLTALRQNNLVRLLAYSGVAQAGFMLAPLAVAGRVVDGEGIAQTSVSSVVTYLIIYAIMNLGAFAIVITVARRTGSGHIDSFNGLFQWSPGLAGAMTVFLASLAGIPPLGGWFAKFGVFRALLEAEVWWGVVLAAIAAVNTVIGFGYYGKLASRMWFEDAPEQFETSRIKIPFALMATLGITVVLTVASGVVPEIITQFSDVDVPAGVADSR